MIQPSARLDSPRSLPLSELVSGLAWAAANAPNAPNAATAVAAAAAAAAADRHQRHRRLWQPNETVWLRPGLLLLDSSRSRDNWSIVDIARSSGSARPPALVIGCRFQLSSRSFVAAVEQRPSAARARQASWLAR